MPQFVVRTSKAEIVCKCRERHLTIYLMHLVIAKVIEGSMLSKTIYNAPIPYKLDKKLITGSVYILHLLLNAIDKAI